MRSRPKPRPDNVRSRMRWRPRNSCEAEAKNHEAETGQRLEFLLEIKSQIVLARQRHKLRALCIVIIIIFIIMAQQQNTKHDACIEVVI